MIARLPLALRSRRPQSLEASANAESLARLRGTLGDVKGPIVVAALAVLAVACGSSSGGHACGYSPEIPTDAGPDARSDATGSSDAAGGAGQDAAPLAACTSVGVAGYATMLPSE